MTRTEAEAWLEANFQSYAREKKADGSTVPVKELVAGICYEYSYSVQAVLGDKSVVFVVKLHTDSELAGATALWKNGEPKNPLAASVDGIEDQLRSWAMGNIADAVAVSQIRQIQLDDYPRQVLCKVAVQNGSDVDLLDYLVSQNSGQQPVAYKVL